ncbi:MAG: diguanylate cyclase [Hahellaceae bacterium]|nr:diguanylate cyclase [Hahellaceae bacterium]
MNASDDLRQKILIADDEKLNRSLLAGLFREEYRVILAKDGAQVLEKVSLHQPDLILLDIMMPGMNGYEVLVRLKGNPTTQSIPVIFITALDSEQEEEKGILMGASDYIAKPFRNSILKARVNNHMQMVRQRQLLEELANMDGLTNIANRRCFENVMAAEWSRCKRARLPLSVLMIDVDYFKDYNDCYGHGGGDHVLRLLARTLSSCLRRPSDRVARYGGEEFIILLPETDGPGARVQAERIRDRVASLKIRHELSEVSEWLTISVGGATVVPSESIESGWLLDEADKRLYRAKKMGRDRIDWA